jgi:hypothetical protein
LDAGYPAPPATYPDGGFRRDLEAPKDFVPSLFGLAPGGVCRAAGVAADAVRSYRTFSPLPRCTQRAAAVRSLWHFPWTRARRTLSGTACLWSPDFPPRQLAGAAVRPTDNHRHGGGARPRQGARRLASRERAAMPRPRPRCANRSVSVARVDSSPRPSICSGRKWRWKAVTTSCVAES